MSSAQAAAATRGNKYLIHTNGLNDDDDDVNGKFYLQILSCDYAQINIQDSSWALWRNQPQLIPNGVSILGRSRKNYFSILFDPGVSKHQCTITNNNGVLTLQNFASKNPTTLQNGANNPETKRKITGIERLQVGDIIGMGNTKLLVTDSKDFIFD